MIRINLLKAQKEIVINSGDFSDVSSGEEGGFLSKFFSKSGKEPSAPVESTGTSSQVGAVVKLVIIMSIAGGLLIYQEIHIPQLKNILADENAKLSELSAYNQNSEALVAEIKKQKENKNIIEKQIASLDGLSKVRSKYVKALDLIQTQLPERMWLVELKSSGDNLAAKGVSYSENEISEFLSRVGKSVYFSDVSLISSEDSKDKSAEKSNFKKFHINFNLEVPK